MQPTEENRSPRLRPGPLFTVTACVFLFGAMVSFHPGDWPSPDQYPNVSPPANACGVVGAYAAYHLRYWLGLGGYAILASLAVCGIAALFHHRLSSRGERVLGVALLALCSAAIAHLIQIPTSGMLPVGNGGVVGLWLGDLLRRNLDRLGTVIVMTSAVLVGLAFATDGLVFKTPAVLRVAARITASGLRFLRTSGRGRPWLARAGAGRSTRAAAVTAAESAELLQPFHPISTALLPSPRRSRRSRRDMQPTLFEDEDENPDSVVDEPAPKGRRTVPARPAKPRGVSDASESACDGEAEQAEAVPSSARSRSAAGGNARRGADADDSEGSAAGLSFPRVNFLQTSEDEPPEPYPRQIENWSLPSLELLHDPQYGFDAQQEQFVRGQARILEQTLEDFRVEARVVEIDTGPVITMFELKLGAGIKVSQIAALSNDIARALKSNGIRVVAPIPGKNTIGIEVPNREKERVRLGELLLHSGRRASEMALPLFLGKDAGGSPLVSDLAQMPHMLIAGTTGSGKSVCLNAVILSVLMTQRPDKVKLILIDPKMVELSQYKDVPHLMCPIVTDMIRAQKILDWAVTNMDERYAQL
ncbi:MAG: DNA translocase FtsK 4TM domain-containing protein, partial [Phycisphaerae bacterium]